MKYVALWLVYTLSLTSCNVQNKKKQNDFVQTSQKLLRLINERDSTAIFKLMWSESAIENKRGNIIKNELAVINKYLDTIPDIKTLSYKVKIFNNDPVNYAVVTIPLREGEESFSVQIFFAHPNLKYKGQIRTYDFQLTPKSYKLNQHPKIGNDGS